MPYTLRFTADIQVPNGGDTDAYGDGCEPGHGYDVVSGYVNPRWDRWRVVDCDDSVIDTAPTETYDPAWDWCEDHDCTCEDPSECTNKPGPVLWLARWMFEYLPGGPCFEPGSGTVYGSDDLDGLSDPDPANHGKSATRALHPDGFSDEQILTAIDMRNNDRRAWRAP